MKTHGGARKGAGRPKKNSPPMLLRVLESPYRGIEAKSRAAYELAQFRWDRKDRQAFLRSAGVDYVASRARVVDQVWDALLVGLPKMAEHGYVIHAWFAYKMISRKRYGFLRPRPEVLERVRALAPQGARALWRIAVTNDPKDSIYKSTLFLRIRRQARRELCRGLGIPISKQLVRVAGDGFVSLLLRTIAESRAIFSPEQAVVLAGWADRERGVRFLESGLKAGVFRIREVV